MQTEIYVKKNQNQIFQKLLQDYKKIEIEKIEKKLEIQQVIKLGSYKIFSELTEFNENDYCK